MLSVSIIYDKTHLDRGSPFISVGLTIVKAEN